LQLVLLHDWRRVVVWRSGRIDFCFFAKARNMVNAAFPPRNLAELYYWLDRAGGLFSLTQLALGATILLLALAAPRFGSRFFEAVERRFSGVAYNPVGQIIAVGLLAVLLRAAVLPWLGTPVPAVHDEQSLVLQAHTYLAGRLANPSPPFWEHFETFHVNVAPAYASMYFPGRGLPLAAGLLIADNAWIGVWLSFALLAMASVWMLQGWVSLPMAFLGGVLIVLRLGVFSYWINSYWGGAFTALGAMLVIGALPRILRKPGWGNGLVIGLGAAILMTTRTYEGALLCLPVAALILLKFIKPTWPGPRLALLKTAVPALLLVGLGGVALLQYNHATTGSYAKTPYQLNRETYSAAPAFLVSKPIVSQNRGPAYFRDFYEAEASNYNRRGSAAKLAVGIAGKVFYTWNFFIGAILTAAFVAGLWAARRSWFLIGTLVFFCAGYFIETWNFPHYTAPIFPVLLILTLRGFEWLRTFEWRGQPTGLFLTRAMPAATALSLVLPLMAVVSGAPKLENSLSNSCCKLVTDDFKPRLKQTLLESPGPDLVLIKDGPNNPVHFELVFNDPDIDRSEVVWAHWLSEDKAQRLMDHYEDRRVWEFEWTPETEETYRLTERKR
jgi:hypothetical protein